MKKVFLINIYEDIPTDTLTLSLLSCCCPKIFPKENLKQKRDKKVFFGKPKKLATTTGSFAFYEIFVFFFFCIFASASPQVTKEKLFLLLLRPKAMKIFGVDKLQTKVG